MPDILIKSALGGAPTQSLQTAEQPKSAEDIEIEKIADQLSVCIKLVGCGGAGCNTVNRCIDGGLSGIQMLALNTDAKHLLTIKSPKKILIGRRRPGVLAPGQGQK